MSSLLKINKNHVFDSHYFLHNFKCCSGGKTATICESRKSRTIKIIEFQYVYRPELGAWNCLCAKPQETIWFGAHATFEKFTSRSTLLKSCCGSKKSRDHRQIKRFPLDQWSILTFEVPVRRVNGKQNQPSKKWKMLFSLGVFVCFWHSDHSEIQPEVKKVARHKPWQPYYSL